MNANIRRLVFDIGPLWAASMALVYAVIAVIDWTELAGGGAAHGSWWMGGLSLCLPAAASAPKFGLWRTLPVSRRDRARGQWWLAQGAPILILTAIMTALSLVAAAEGRLAATPESILAQLGGQLALGSVAIGAVVVGSLLRQRFGAFVGPAFVIVAFVLIRAAAFAGRPADGHSDPEFIAAGVAALVGAALSYVAAERISAACASQAPRRAATEAPSVELATLQAAGPQPRLVGWPAVLRPLLIYFAVALAAVVGVQFLTGDVLSRGRQADQFAAAMIIVIGGGSLATLIAPALRVLRSLPLGPAALTVLLQGAVATLTLALFAVDQLLVTLSGGAAPAWWMTTLAALPATAVRLPLHSRLGPQAGAFAGILPLVVVPFLSIAHPAPDPVLIAIDVLLLAAVWTWTWWEFACGRSAYRTWTAGAVRWRGRG